MLKYRQDPALQIHNLRRILLLSTRKFSPFVTDSIISSRILARLYDVICPKFKKHYNRLGRKYWKLYKFCDRLSVVSTGNCMNFYDRLNSHLLKIFLIFIFLKLFVSSMGST